MVTEYDQIVHQPCCSLDRILNLLNRSVNRLSVFHMTTYLLTGPTYDGQQICEVVSYSTGQTTQCFHLLSPVRRVFQTLALGNIRDRLDDMGTTVGRQGLGPLDENPGVLRKRRLIHRHFARADRLGHPVKSAGCWTPGDFLVTGLAGDIPELVEACLVLKLNPVGRRIDHGNDDRLSV